MLCHLIAASLLLPTQALLHVHLDQVLHHVFVLLLAIELPRSHRALHVVALEDTLDDAGDQHAGSDLAVLGHPGQINSDFVSTIPSSVHNPINYSLFLVNVVGVGLRQQLVVKQVLEDSEFDALQDVVQVGRPLRDASLQTDLRVDLVADICPDVPQSIVH